MRDQTSAGRLEVSGDAQLAQASRRFLVAGKPAAHIAALDESAGGDATIFEVGENARYTGAKVASNLAVAKFFAFRKFRQVEPLAERTDLCPGKRRRRFELGKQFDQLSRLSSLKLVLKESQGCQDGSKLRGTQNQSSPPIVREVGKEKWQRPCLAAGRA